MGDGKANISYLLQQIDISSIINTKLNEKIINIQCGANHTIFLTNTGKIYGCGANKNGECGAGDNIETIPLVD